MNKNVNTDIADLLAIAASQVTFAKKRVRQTPEAKKERAKQAEMAKMILEATESAKTVEDLIYIETSLQQLDKQQAATPQDQTSIENAERDYRQITETVDQMRKAPAEYFKANASLKETGGDVRKMPRSRGLQQIAGNKARLQNRSSFSDENSRMVWDARIVLATKTESMLKALHNGLVADLERNLETREQPEEKPSRRRARGRKEDGGE